MGLPGHRRTSSHKRRRAAHFALKPLNIMVCPNCKAPKLPHRACGNCLTYAGRKLSTGVVKAVVVKTKKVTAKAKDDTMKK